MLLGLTIGNMMINNIVVLLPGYLAEKVWDSTESLSSNDTALILAIFSIAALFMAPVNSIFKNHLGSKNTLVLGFALQTATTFGLGILHHVDNPHVFKWIAIALRFFQGQGNTLMQVTGYSVIT